jgi:hypothetical protein
MDPYEISPMDYGFEDSFGELSTLVCLAQLDLLAGSVASKMEIRLQRIENLFLHHVPICELTAPATRHDTA